MTLLGTLAAVPLSVGAAALPGAQSTAADAEPEPLECVIEPNILVEVSSSETGVLSSVRVDEADVVREGEVIAELDTGVERAALDLSRSRADADAEVALLERDYQFNSRKRERTDELFDKSVVSAQLLDEARTAEELARLRLAAAAEKRRQARLQATRDELALARRIVRSPISGVVVERYKTAGEYVEGDPIAQVAQLDPLRVELVAPISMLGAISVGMRARIVPELAIEGDFVASVVSVDPIVDAATATFGVRMALPNPDRRLPPGLRCTLALLPAAPEAHAAATPPGEALDGEATSPVAESPSAPSPESVGSVTESGVGGSTVADPVASETARPEAVSEAASGAAAPVSVPSGSVASGSVASGSVASGAAPPKSAASESLAAGAAASGPVAVAANSVAAVGDPQRAAAAARPVAEPSATATTVGPAVSAQSAKPDGQPDGQREGPPEELARCATVGPFASAAVVDAVIESLDVDVALELRDAEGAPALWVVLTPRAADGDALRARLAEAGIADHWLLPRGEWKGRVSLGSYRGRRAAERRLRAVRELGFEAEVLPGARASEIWLDLPATPYDAPLPVKVSEILAGDPSLAVRSVPCTRLASR